MASRYRHELPELVTSLHSSAIEYPAASGLILPVDIDVVTAASAAQLAALRTQGVAALRLVLSGVLHSDAYSPGEREALLEESRVSFERDYKLNQQIWRYAISAPLTGLPLRTHGLKARRMTPLEYEMLRWDPVWEGAGEGGRRSNGMEMIYYLMENWTPFSGDDLDSRPERQSGNNPGSPAPYGSQFSERQSQDQLLELVRNACLLRLEKPLMSRDDTGVAMTYSKDEMTEKLFQNVVRYVPYCKTSNENMMASVATDHHRRSAEANDCAERSDLLSNYNVSVNYERSGQLPSEKRKGKNALTTKNLLDDSQPSNVWFDALISIDNFHKTLRRAMSQMQRDAELRTGRNRTQHPSQRHDHARSHPGTSGESSRHDNYTVRIYTNHCAGHQMSLPSSGNSSPHLRVEFLAARRIWVLAIDANSLELSVISSARIPTCEGPGLVSAVEARENDDIYADESMVASPRLMQSIHAEVRVVYPSSIKSTACNTRMDEGQGCDREFVFTFPEINGDVFNLPSKSTSLNDNDKDLTSTSYGRSRIDTCFPDTREGTGPYVNSGGIPIVKGAPTGFYDKRLLHDGGQLLLEMRIRVQSLRPSDYRDSAYNTSSHVDDFSSREHSPMHIRQKHGEVNYDLRSSASPSSTNSWDLLSLLTPASELTREQPSSVVSATPPPSISASNDNSSYIVVSNPDHLSNIGSSVESAGW